MHLIITVLATNTPSQFGAIVAVSHPTSPRRNGLIVAANITELDITIPEQPEWTEKDVENFRDPESSTITRGSALAWLGHLNALEWFLSTDLETVLILEDDVDWDIHLRTQQVPKVAAAARTLLSSQSLGFPTGYNLDSSSFIDPITAGGYWGDTSGAANWDIMYLGHCGDRFPSEVWTNTSDPRYPARALFPDPSMPAPESLHDFTRDFIESIEVPPFTRFVHQSVAPLCSFGFALTRPAARKLLYQIANKEHEGGCQAYDVRILEACRDLDFRCWTTNPELFHHQDRPSEISVANSVGNWGKSKEQFEQEEDEKARQLEYEDLHRAELDEENKRKQDEHRLEQDRLEAEQKQEEEERRKIMNTPGVDEQGRLGGPAPNIACGVRGSSMYTENPATLEFLREVVGRQGHCLRDQMAEDMSKLY